MKVHLKHGKVTQIMHGSRRNYRYVWDVSQAEGGPEGDHQAHRRPGGTPIGRARRPPGWWVPPPVPPFGLYHPRDLKTPEQEDFPEFCRRSMAETYIEENSFPVGRFRRGELLPEGEIVV